MSRHKKPKKHRKLRLVIKIFILLILLSILGVGLFLYLKYGDMVFGMRDEAKALVMQSTPETFRTSETSIAYSNEGKQIAVLKGEKDSYYITLDKIPEYVQDAFIVTEDKKYYDHNGIDIEGIGRAAIELFRNNGQKTQGASTITQQLARGIFLNSDKTYERKLKEIFIALELEKKYTKQQLLEFYLNTIYFANGYYGIEAAAKGYFSKSSSDLSLGQLTFLCAIPNNPSKYDPEKRYKNTVIRKNRILDQMLKDGVINRVEYDQAYNEKIVLNIKEVKKRDYIETFVMYCAVKKIMEKNGFQFRYSFSDNDDKEQYEELYEEEYATAQQMLLNNGYRIYTSLDLKKQKKLQKAINQNLKQFKGKTKKGIYKMQGAGTCIDNETGRVVAIVGGRGQDTSGYSLNRAFQSFRQPGSSIKPVIVYTPTLERGATRNTIVNDHKFKDGPSNSSGHYYGHITLEFAVQHSLNTVAWQLFEKLTPEVGLEYLLNMNYSHIVKSDYYLPASLGGLTYGCSTLEMASAYATIGNEGKYRDPTCIVSIKDSDGNKVVEDDVDEKYIYKAKAANTMIDILQGVFTKGTASSMGGVKGGMTCAGKTGTTNDKKDGWFCGLTPYYTTAVWVGFDSPKTVDDLYGNTYPLRIWRAYMDDIHDGLKKKKFAYQKKKKKDAMVDEGSSGSRYVPDVDYENEGGGGGGGSVDVDPDDDNGVDKKKPKKKKPKQQAEETEPEPEPEPVDQDSDDEGGGEVDKDPADEEVE